MITYTVNQTGASLKIRSGGTLWECNSYLAYNIVSRTQLLFAKLFGQNISWNVLAHIYFTFSLEIWNIYMFYIIFIYMKLQLTFLLLKKAFSIYRHINIEVHTSAYKYIHVYVGLCIHIKVLYGAGYTRYERENSILNPVQTWCIWTRKQFKTRNKFIF